MTKDTLTALRALNNWELEVFFTQNAEVLADELVKAFKTSSNMKNLIKNFYKETPIYEACIDDPVRPCFNYVLFRFGKAWASDAHIAVRADISSISNFEREEIDLLENTMIHRTALKEIFKASLVDIEKRTTTIKKKDKEGKDVEEEMAYPVFIIRDEFCIREFPCYPNGYQFTYPSIDKIFEQTTSEAKTEIRFGQKYLETLLKSMGLKNQPFKIEFGEGFKVCRVTSSQSVCEGLIMPLAVE